MKCKAGHGAGPNYNRSHKWRDGMYDGRPRDACRFCGRWRE